jgi:hypothetical protein
MAHITSICIVQDLKILKTTIGHGSFPGLANPAISRTAWRNGCKSRAGSRTILLTDYSLRETAARRAVSMALHGRTFFVIA